MWSLAIGMHIIGGRLWEFMASQCFPFTVSWLPVWWRYDFSVSCFQASLPSSTLSKIISQSKPSPPTTHLFMMFYNSNRKLTNTGCMDQIAGAKAGFGLWLYARKYIKHYNFVYFLFIYFMILLHHVSWSHLFKLTSNLPSTLAPLSPK